MATAEHFPYERGLTEFDRVVAAAQREIALQVKAAILEGNLARRDQRLLQLSRVLATLDQLGAYTDPAARRMVADAFEQAAARAADQIAGLHIVAPESPAAFAGVSLDAVQALQDTITGNLRASRETIGRQVEDVYAKAGRRAALRAVLGADGSPRAAARQMALDLRQQGLTGFVDKAGKQWKLDTYSKMVVRTTTREAVVQGAVARMASHGVDLARVSIHGGSCPICKPYEGRLVDLTGSTRDFDGEAVMSGPLPPYHPNAVPAGTLVRPVGELLGGVRADWRGPLVDLTSASGVRLAIGPNHPVLTPRGWLKASLLRRGDQVLRRCDGEGRGARPGTGEYFDQPPALVEDVFGALAATGVLARLVATADHLHGDGNFCEGEIDVVRAERALWHEGDALLAQHLSEHALVGAGVQHAGLSGAGARELDRVAVGGSIGRALPDLDATRFQPPQERRPRDWQAARELLGGLAGDIASDEIVDIRYFDWVGQAFDLETSQGSYFANGLYVSNCAHSLSPVAVGVERLRRELAKTGGG